MFSSKQAIYVDLDKAYSEFLSFRLKLACDISALMFYKCFYACSYGFTADSNHSWNLQLLSILIINFKTITVP
jgi:hypothetical protein